MITIQQALDYTSAVIGESIFAPVLGVAWIEQGGSNPDDIMIRVPMIYEDGSIDHMVVWLEPRGDGTSFIYGEW